MEFKELEVRIVFDFFPFNKDARGINNLGGSENSWPGLSRAKFSTQLTAVIITNIYGQSADFEKIMSICDQKIIPIIEDAAESLGAEYQSKKSGSFGLLSILSFNGNKIVTAGVGGAVLTASEHSFKKVDYLSKQAKDDSFNYVHNEMGFNYRLSNINAALGLAQAENLKAILEKKNDIHNLYKKYFKENEKFEIMDTPDYARNNNWLNILKVLNGNKDGILLSLIHI